MRNIKRSPLLLMALTILIDFTGFGLVLPLLPFWAQRLGANPTEIGLIITVYALAQFIFTPILGTLSDRYGRKPVIVSSLLIEALSLALSAFAGSLPILLFARFIGGLGASNIGSAQAVVSDVTPPEGRAKGMGLIGAAIGLGFVIGPALGGILAPLGTAIPFWAATVVALINALLVALLLPETRTKQAAVQETASPLHRGSWLAGWRNALRDPIIARLVGINLLFTVAFTAMEALFPFFAQHSFGWGATQTGYIFTYVGIIIVIMQGGLVGILVKRWGEQRILQIGLVMLAAGLLLLTYSTQLAWLLITLGILSAGNGAVTPTISTLLSFASSSEAQGETLGLAQGIAGLGRILGPVIAGQTYQIGGPAAPFIAGGLLVVLAAIIAIPTLSSMHKLRQVETSMEESIAQAEVSSPIGK